MSKIRSEFNLILFSLISIVVISLLYFAKCMYCSEDLYKKATPIWNNNNNNKTQKACPITWVSAYFNIPSKHDHVQYMNWLDNLLSIKMCLVLFTDNAEVKAKAMKSRANPLIIDTDLEAKSMELDYGKNISRKEF